MNGSEHLQQCLSLKISSSSGHVHLVLPTIRREPRVLEGLLCSCSLGGVLAANSYLLVALMATTIISKKSK